MHSPGSTSALNPLTESCNLQGVLDVPLYGRVAALQLFRPAGEPRDLLLLLTERNNFCVLGFDEESGEQLVAC